jgi:S-adenosylmethionine decarboxylase
MNSEACIGTPNHDFYTFEGPEKKIEIDYFLSNHNSTLRNVSREDWVVLLSLINCTILSKISNDLCDAYVLSESSLFVFDSKVIIKTCGQISLLKCLELLIQYGNKVGATNRRIFFARRNFIFPDQQSYPHSSFDDEVSYLKQHFPTGDAYIFGPQECDHHYIFVHHNEEVPQLPASHTLEILMTDLNKDVMKQFYRTEDFVSSEDVTNKTKIRSLFGESALVDAHAFEPCGFSLNALDSGLYYTIHITPQPEFSYISFEANLLTDTYLDVVERVTALFKPDNFTVLVMSDRVPFEPEVFSNFYHRGSAQHNFDDHGDVLTWFSFRRCETSPAPTKKHIQISSSGKAKFSQKESSQKLPIILESGLSIPDNGLTNFENEQSTLISVESK